VRLLGLVRIFALPELRRRRAVVLVWDYIKCQTLYLPDIGPTNTRH
jgi:hypothetical protein